MLLGCFLGTTPHYHAHPFKYFYKEKDFNQHFLELKFLWLVFINIIKIIKDFYLFAVLNEIFGKLE